ncbi:hypothetical protein FKM82_022720 [Ascaphus truei]
MFFSMGLFRRSTNLMESCVGAHYFALLILLFPLQYPVTGLGIACTCPLPDYNLDVDSTLCELVAITSRILKKLKMMDKQFSHHRCKIIRIRKVWKRDEKDENKHFSSCLCQQYSDVE